VLRWRDSQRLAAARLARRAQRLSLARDLHDLVAHDVTGIVLEAQAALLSDQPAGTGSLLARIEASGQRALSAMDDMIRALHDPDEPAVGGELTRRYGLADLSGLVERFAASGRIAAALDAGSGLAAAVPADTQALAYRVVVEGLTNVRRHARAATRVGVRVCAPDAATLLVCVEDDGDGRPAGTGRRGGGTGLAGLAERVGAAGGHLTAGPVGRGFRLTATLPVRGPRSAPAG